jgi:hypothetical protein
MIEPPLPTSVGAIGLGSLKSLADRCSSKNECLLSNMHETDRKTWSAVLANFGDILAKARPSEPATVIQELLAYME